MLKDLEDGGRRERLRKIRRTEDEAVRERLLAEAGKTAKGRHLLEYLYGRDVEILTVPDVNPFFEPYNRKDVSFSGSGIYFEPDLLLALSASEPLSFQLHALAHETRHGAQAQADYASPGHKSAADIAPRAKLLKDRLHEMDADTFAVAFVTAHCRETGRGFDEDFLAKKDPRLTPLYQRYHDRLSAGVPAAQAMQRVAKIYFNEPSVKESYDLMAVAGLLPLLEMLETWTGDPSGDDARYGRILLQEHITGRVISPRDYVVERAHAYSRLFPEAGWEDYMAGWDDDRFFDYLSANPDGAATEEILKDVLPRFEALCDIYHEKVPFRPYEDDN